MNKHLTFGLPKKSMEDLWLTPSRRFKVGKYYHIEKNDDYDNRNCLWANRNSRFPMRHPFQLSQRRLFRNLCSFHKQKPCNNYRI